MRSREKILEHLRTGREATVEELAEVTGLAGVTVRHHLGVMRDRGFVEVRTTRSGRGRPPNLYRLAPAGASSLDHGGALRTLADDLLAALKETGPGAADAFFRRMAAEAVRKSTALEAVNLEGRLDAAMAALAERGFTMRWERDGEAFMVRELGCPYRALSRNHREICSLDAAILELAVGAQISRVYWRGAGDAFCAFRVVPEGAAQP